MNQSNKKVLPAAGESMTSSILTASGAAVSIWVLLRLNNVNNK
ncbi:hypothetical protein ACVNP1_01615 [Staphylococcus aureus]